MLKYILKLLVFDYAFSFIAGLLLMLPALILSSVTKEDSKSMIWIGGIMGVIPIVLQSLIISSATELSLINDPTRSSFLWYLIGFCFSTPLALVTSKNKNEYDWIGFPIAYLSYLIGVFTNIDINISFVFKLSDYLSV